jgi:acetoacetyl-CoA synthetase
MSAASNRQETPKELWRPSSPEKTQIYEFKTQVGRKYGLDLERYDDLWQWSVLEPAKFWEEVWHYTAIKAHKPYSKVS